MTTSVPPEKTESRQSLFVSALVVITVVALAGACAFTVYRLDRHAVSDVAAELRRIARVVAAELVASPRGLDDEAFVRQQVALLASLVEARLTVIASDGRVIADSEVPLADLDNHSDRPEVQKAHTLGLGIDERDGDDNGLATVYLAVPVRRGDRIVGYARSAREKPPLTAALLLAIPLLSYFAAAALAIVLIGRMASRRVERDAQRLVQKAEAVAEQLRESESAMRKTEERFQLAARATNDVLWDWDVVSGALWWSEGIRKLLGDATPPATIDAWAGLVHPEEAERVRGSLDEFIRSTREVWNSEYRIRRADGSYAWVLDRGIALRGSDAAVRMIGSMIDLTERKEAERMKSDFVSFVSHQLRTPLAGMNWMLELAADAEDLPEEARTYIQDARESATRLVSLVNDLLDIARLESGRTVMAQETIQLDHMTISVLREMQMLINEKRHFVQFDADGAPTGLGDPQMIRQVISNLMSNAVKYTPDGGRIEVRLIRLDEQVQWQVRDNGMGIPRAAQARLFEKFFRADNAVSKNTEGTGLGLHLVRLVVEHAGGQVWCESDEGRGTTIAFTLPLGQQGEQP